MAVAIRLNAVNSKHVVDTLRSRLRHISGEGSSGGGWGYKALNQSLAKYMVSDTRRRFSTKIAPDGTRWADLSTATENLRARADMVIRVNARMSATADRHLRMRYLPGDTLVASGRLKAGIRIGYVGGKELEVRASAVDPETGYDYARVQQTGLDHTSGMIPGKRITARPFLGFSEANRKTIRRKIVDYLDTGKL